MAETVGVGKIDVNLARGDERGEQGDGYGGGRETRKGKHRTKEKTSQPAASGEAVFRPHLTCTSNLLVTYE
jgi:hypothetical protein